MTASAVSVRGVQYGYGHHPVLRDIHLSVSSGEILGLLGANGSGKSTLMSLLSGVLPLQGGTISMGGWPGGHPTLRAHLGVVFQSNSLDPKLTVEENITLALRLYGLSRKECTPWITEGVSHMGLEDKLKTPVYRLSGGFQRRCDILRSLLHRPLFLLLDEPTAGLDESSFRRVWQWLQSLRREHGITLVVATHRPEEGEQCDRIALLWQGRILRVDTPAALKARVRGDIVVLHTQGDPRCLCEGIRQQWQLQAWVDGPTVRVECVEGHRWIPKLIETTLTSGSQIVSIEWHPPTLADVFLNISGHSLFLRQAQEEVMAS